MEGRRSWKTNPSSKAQHHHRGLVGEVAAWLRGRQWGSRRTPLCGCHLPSDKEQGNREKDGLSNRWCCANNHKLDSEQRHVVQKLSPKGP